MVITDRMLNELRDLRQRYPDRDYRNLMLEVVKRYAGRNENVYQAMSTLSRAANARRNASRKGPEQEVT